jgi:cobalt-zinc-cadmium efflux system membrane fusion protein
MPIGCAASNRRTGRNDAGKDLARDVRMKLHDASLPLLAALVALAVAPACTESHGESAATAAAESPSLAADGTVRLPKASLQSLQLETVRTDAGSFQIRVPARAEFKDGAVSRVGAPASGRVMSVAVKTGERVRAGQPLLTIAAPDAASARDALSLARTALREAKAAVDRQNRMMQEGVGIEREQLEAGFRLSQAQAEVDRAEATASLVGDGSGADLVVKSPMAGTVIDVKTSVGAAVAPGGEPLIEVGDPEAVWIVADVTDHDLPLIKEGTTAEVLLNVSSSPLSARVVSIGTVVDPSLRTAPVRMALASPIPGLRPGTFGRALIMTAAGGTTLPAEAVLIRGGKDWIVYVAKSDDTFERRSVVAGRPIDGRVQVLSGLAPGDRVVIHGALLLDGSAEQLL